MRRLTSCWLLLGLLLLAAPAFAAAPVISSCGSTPDGSLNATASDSGGTITIGGGAVVSCTLTFSATYDPKMRCFVASALGVVIPVTTTTTTMTLAATLTGGVVDYVCFKP